MGIYSVYIISKDRNIKLAVEVLHMGPILQNESFIFYIMATLMFEHAACMAYEPGAEPRL